MDWYRPLNSNVMWGAGITVTDRTGGARAAGSATSVSSVPLCEIRHRAAGDNLSTLCEVRHDCEAHRFFGRIHSCRERLVDLSCGSIS